MIKSQNYTSAVGNCLIPFWYTQWLFWWTLHTLIGTVWTFVCCKKSPLEVIMCYFKCRQLHFVLAQNCIPLCVVCVFRKTLSLWGATTRLLSSAACFALRIVSGTAALTAFSWMTVNLSKSSFWHCHCVSMGGAGHNNYMWDQTCDLLTNWPVWNWGGVWHQTTWGLFPNLWP